MFYAVTIRHKDGITAIETGVCNEDEVQAWCERAKTIAKETGLPTLAEFRPRERIFEFEPIEDTEN